MKRAGFLLLFAVGLALSGLDIAPPASGVVISRDRIGEVQVRQVPETCGWWDCRAELVARRLPKYRVTYAWSVAGIPGQSTCTVPAALYWQAEIGQPFRCEGFRL